MKKFLWITIVGSVISGLILLSGVLAANGAPQPLASPAALALAECGCSNLKVLQIELRNALRLQQAFSNKIAELRTMNGDSAQGALKVFAEGEARHGLEPIPDYKGPSEFDYSPWGENQRTFNFPTEKLCGMSDSAKLKFDQAVAASACEGIGNALRAHEDVHGNMCRSVGYKAYLAMHGADRAREEVEAYGAQIAVLRAEIARLKKTCGYRATGSDGPTSYSGTVCSLGKEFTVIGHNGPLTYTDVFTPSSGLGGRAGTATLSGQLSGVIWAGSGPYEVKGIDTDKPQIVWKVATTVRAGISGGGSGVAHIDLVPLETDECNKR